MVSLLSTETDALDVVNNLIVMNNFLASIDIKVFGHTLHCVYQYAGNMYITIL